NRFRYVVTRIQRGAIKSLNQADLVLIDDRGIVEPDAEETRFSLSVRLEAIGWSQDPINTGGQNVNLWALLTIGCNEVLGILEVAVTGDGFTKQATRVKSSS